MRRSNLRVVVTGATGNVGTALIDVLSRDDGVDEVVGIARRIPAGQAPPKVTWRRLDISTDPLRDAFGGADAVVHLAWLLQPSRRREVMRRVNVEGSRRVFAAAVSAGVPALIHASSVGAYGPGPKDRAVDESWSTAGIPTSGYSRDKSAVEAILDDVERTAPSLRVVRLRPGIILQSRAAGELSRLFLGPLVPSRLLRPSLVKIVPSLAGLRIQAVHSRDCAEAYRLAIHGDVAGAFNVAAEPVLDASTLAGALHARPVPLPVGPVRAVADLTWRLHLQPTEVGWLDLALQTPLMDIDRARQELGWAPQHSAVDALVDLLGGFGSGDTGPTAPLAGGHETGASASEAPGPPG